MRYGCLRGLLHHSIGDPSVWRRGSAWANPMAGRPLEDRCGVTGAVGNRVRRWVGTGCACVDTPQPCEGLRHRSVERKCVLCRSRCQRVRLRSSLVGYERDMPARTWYHQVLVACTRPARSRNCAVPLVGSIWVAPYHQRCRQIVHAYQAPQHAKSQSNTMRAAPTLLVGLAPLVVIHSSAWPRHQRVRLKAAT